VPGDPDKSYVARLFAKGGDAVLKKIGEEATEVVMACKDGDPKKVVAEVADLWFHTMIALAQHGLAPARRCWPSCGAARACRGRGVRRPQDADRERRTGS
jgi:phosphoribosyl-ATP pyrophosphohydrolase